MSYLLQEIFYEIESGQKQAPASIKCDCPKCSSINTARDCYPSISDLPTVQLGKIYYNGKTFYQFTPEDALWFAKLLKGEAGSKDDINGHAVLWTMINRFTLFKHLVSSWKTFSHFIKAYSTPLQCPLKSPGAMARVWTNRTKRQILCTGGSTTYKGRQFPKVIYKGHYELQKKGWSTLPKEVKAIVLRMLTGQIQNPGIGLASEFANTRDYFVQRYSRRPSDEEWKTFTLNFLKTFKNGDYAWIGPRHGLDQKNKNVFFIKKSYLKTDPNIIEIKM